MSEPTKDIRLKVAECINSLDVAIQASGGTVPSVRTLSNMSVLEFITEVAAQNEIRFEYKGPQ